MDPERAESCRQLIQNLAKKLNSAFGPGFFTVKMTIEFRPLLDDTHYRTVKGIFSNAFAKSYDRDTIITSWGRRDKRNSFVFYDTDLNKVIGFVLMHRTTKVKMYLSYIAMTDESRGKGLGTKMMKRLIKYATDKGCSLSLVPFSDVIPWYKSLGFNVTSDPFNYSIHKYLTRKNTKFMEALDIDKPRYKLDDWYEKIKYEDFLFRNCDFL